MKTKWSPVPISSVYSPALSVDDLCSPGVSVVPFPQFAVSDSSLIAWNV